MARLATWFSGLTLALLAGAAIPAQAAWNLTLPDTVTVADSVTRIGDLTQDPLPVLTGDVIVHAGGVPGTSVRLSRQIILRKLVAAGLARGVQFRGGTGTVIVYTGQVIDKDALRREIRRTLQPMVPSGLPQAPASWFEVEIPRVDLCGGQDFQVSTTRRKTLSPGRNHVRVRVGSKGQNNDFTVIVTLHHYGETAVAARPLARGTALEPDLFTWQWVDMAEGGDKLVSSRGSLLGNSVTRALQLGDPLRKSDLKQSPVVLAGDSVELLIRRGQVVVSARAFARQNGCLGQTIPVRNELTGQLVNARVSGPGQVEWRR